MRDNVGSIFLAAQLTLLTSKVIPTPRWSTYDAVKLGVNPPAEVPATIQERAWSSPIWYTPDPPLVSQAEGHQSIHHAGKQ